MLGTITIVMGVVIIAAILFISSTKKSSFTLTELNQYEQMLSKELNRYTTPLPPEPPSLTRSQGGSRFPNTMTGRARTDGKT